MNTRNILETFLDHLKIKYTKEYLRTLYNEHPYKNTLFGLSDILSRYNLKTTGFRINSDENLSELNTPFLTSINNQFAVVLKISENNINYWTENNYKTTPTKDFLNYWNRTSLIAENKNRAIEPNYSEHKKVEIFNFLRNKLFLISIILLLILAIISGQSYSDIGLLMLLLINIGDIYISYLLLQKQIHISNNHADKICSLLKHGCNSVLDSSASKIMGVIGWSEIGFSYFVSNTCLLLLFPSFPPYLALVNCCALPYSLWSVWYQKFTVKKWCLLCLIIQILLWLLFIINIVFNHIHIPQLSFFTILIVGSLYFISIAITNILLPYLVDKKQLKILQLGYNQLKMDIGLFKSKLKEQPHYELDQNTSQIIWGNKNAKIFVTIVTNPHCEYCATIHQQTDNLLERLGDKICIQYIFTSFYKELETSTIFLIATYLSNKLNMDEKREVFNQWFNFGKNKKQALFDKYNLDLTDHNIIEEKEAHIRWCNKSFIAVTPTIIVNGYRLPEEYNLDDITYYTDLDTNK